MHHSKILLQSHFFFCRTFHNFQRSAQLGARVLSDFYIVCFDSSIKDESDTENGLSIEVDEIANAFLFLFFQDKMYFFHAILPGLCI